MTRAIRPDRWHDRNPQAGTAIVVPAGALLVACLVLCSMAWPARAEPARESRFNRVCSTQPAGVSVPGGYRLSSITVGPLSLFSFGSITVNGRRSSSPASRFGAVRPGRYRLQKLWAILPPGQWAKVTVPAAGRGALSLGYDPSLWNGGGWDGTARVAQGKASVIFQACPRKEAQGRPPLVVYDGGLIVAGARCAQLDVLARGWKKPKRVVVALGRRRC